MRRSGGRRPGGPPFVAPRLEQAAMPATWKAAAGNKERSTPSASHRDSSARMTAWAWASGSRRPFDSPVELEPDGYGLTSSAIQSRHSSWSGCGSRPLAGNLWIAARSFRDRAVIGRQLHPGQRGKQPDRGVAPGMLAQPLEHADVRLQKLPPQFFLAATTEQRGDRPSRIVDRDDDVQVSRVVDQAFQRLLSALDADQRLVEAVLIRARPDRVPSEPVHTPRRHPGRLRHVFALPVSPGCP